jgi:hypothetical protein
LSGLQRHGRPAGWISFQELAEQLVSHPGDISRADDWDSKVSRETRCGKRIVGAESEVAPEVKSALLTPRLESPAHCYSSPALFSLPCFAAS